MTIQEKHKISVEWKNDCWWASVKSTVGYDTATSTGDTVDEAIACCVRDNRLEDMSDEERAFRSGFTAGFNSYGCEDINPTAEWEVWSRG